MYKKSVTESDYKRLSALAAAVRGGPKPDRARLLESGLKDALLFRGEDITRNFVTMNSVVRIRDAATGDEYTYHLVFPADADISNGKISVLTPLGAALLGRREGESFSYESPGGSVEVRVEGVEYQPEENAIYGL